MHLSRTNVVLVSLFNLKFYYPPKVGLSQCCTTASARQTTASLPQNDTRAPKSDSPTTPASHVPSATTKRSVYPPVSTQPQGFSRFASTGLSSRTTSSASGARTGPIRAQTGDNMPSTRSRVTTSRIGPIPTVRPDSAGSGSGSWTTDSQSTTSSRRFTAPEQGRATAGARSSSRTQTEAADENGRLVEDGEGISDGGAEARWKPNRAAATLPLRRDTTGAGTTRIAGTLPAQRRAPVSGTARAPPTRPRQIS